MTLPNSRSLQSPLTHLSLFGHDFPLGHLICPVARWAFLSGANPPVQAASPPHIHRGQSWVTVPRHPPDQRY